MTDWIYILSPSFSGSTLLTFLMGAHPAVATIGELKATAMGDVQTYKCSCGARILECGFWRRVGEGVRSAGKPFDLASFGTAFRLSGRSLGDRVVRARVCRPLFEVARQAAIAVIPGLKRDMSVIVEQNRVLSEVVLSVQGGTVFLDGSKDPTRLLHLWRARFANIKVLYLVRDGRGSARSFMAHYGIPMIEAAKVWRGAQESCERILSKLSSGSWTTVRYETLCTEALATLRDICKFVGIDPVAVNGDFRSTEQHILGNAMRLGASGEVRLNEKWRAELTADDLNTFDRLAGDFNRHLGYD